MNKKTIGIIALVVGVVLLLVSLFADSLGIGGAPGIGYKQIAGMVVGALVAVAGGYFAFKK